MKRLDDKELVTLLEQHFGSRLVVKDKYRHVYGERGFEAIYEGVDVSIAWIEKGEEKLIEALRFFTRHSPCDFVAAQIARLRVGTARAAESNEDIELLIDIMIDDCSEYPPDVLADCAETWRRTKTYFPTPRQLRDELDKAVSVRKSVLEALERAPRGRLPKPKRETDWKSIPREEWGEREWSDYVESARGMVRLGVTTPLIDRAGWEAILAKREAEAEEAKKKAVG